ncbi:MAG: ATP-binding cassette domain-containing protein [Pirellulaceae bacterium]
MIELRSIAITAGDFSLRDISFTVAKGSYAMLMGRTGRGKTTILETICGLRKPIAGQVLVDEIDVTDWAPGDRQIGYVPQDLALFPTFTVRGHIEFALHLRKWSAESIQQRTNELAEVLSINHLLDRGIKGLSGGESQRVALGRALSFRPSVLLLDEPLSALDEATRTEMQDLLRDVKTKTGVTTLHVTHSNEEAEALADVRLNLDDGVLS